MRSTRVVTVEVDSRYQTQPEPSVVVTALNDYNIALELRAWLTNEREHMAARADLRERLFEALRGAQVDMPLETLAIVHDAGQASA